MLALEHFFHSIFKWFNFVYKTSHARKPPAARGNAEADKHEQGDCDSSIAATSATCSLADHTYSVEESPRTLKRKMNAVCYHAEATKKRLKYSTAKVFLHFYE
jgi:hypothetical protein